MVDYLIIGFGIAGVSLVDHLLNEGKTVLVIDANHVKASSVAAGMYNPVILNKFTMAWDVHEQLTYALRFYGDIQAKLQVSIDEELRVLRKFHSVEEQNTWFSKIDDPLLSTYLSPYLVTSPTAAIDAPFKYGEVMHTGRILVDKLLEAYKTYLNSIRSFRSEEFEYRKLIVKDSEVVYGAVKAKQVIFCEGYGIKKNPYFNDLPLVGNKGSYLIIKSIGLKLKSALKSKYFLIPMGNHIYKFGATYGHDFLDLLPDEASKEELLKELEKLINVEYTVLDQETAIRPTVKDRRPLLGRHKEYSSLYVLNGMGTRGITVAPTMAKHLVNFIERQVPLPREVDINRFG